MPSDPRTQIALEALSKEIQSFRSSVVRAIEQVRGYLDTHAGNDGSAPRLAAELGAFGADRIDVQRLSRLFETNRSLDPLLLRTMEQALQALSDLVARENEVFLVDVPSGGDLRDAVAGALEEIGTVFSAARAVELGRNLQPHPSDCVPVSAGVPFRRWTQAQRRLAPPLVVHVDGSDLHAAGLAEFLDGTQKLILIVRGSSAPAPLVRLITPETFVLQTPDRTGLDRLVSWKGPGVAAIVPDEAAHFVHDPAAGSELWERLTLTRVPDEMPSKPLGGLSAHQQAQDLRQLQVLATQSVQAAPEQSPAISQPLAATPAPSDPVESLASWLIRQAGLDEVG